MADREFKSSFIRELAEVLFFTWVFT